MLKKKNIYLIDGKNIGTKDEDDNAVLIENLLSSTSIEFNTKL